MKIPNCAFFAKYVATSILLTFAVLYSSSATAQISRLELHSIQSQTPTDQEFLTGNREAKPINIVGELRIPRPGVDRLPAVVLLHGSGGAGALEDQWAREFATQGIATFIVDSFTARGIVSTVLDQDRLSRLVMVVDAYRALEVLANHPRIDASRIIVMGFSRGGGAAHWSAIKRFQAMHGPVSPLAFAAHIAMYPACNRTFLNGTDVVDKPVRIFHGMADDYIPVTECRAYVDRLHSVGKDIKLTEYEGAYHVFDNAAFSTLIKLPQAQTTRGCPLIEETSDGRLVNSETKQVFTYAADPCVQKGSTIGYNAQAHSEATRAIKAFVATVVQPK